MPKTCNSKDPKATNPGYICNPISGRWIKADGACAKKLALAKKSSSTAAQVPMTTSWLMLVRGKLKHKGV
jgi:hypothetical protein